MGAANAAHADDLAELEAELKMSIRPIGIRIEVDPSQVDVRQPLEPASHGRSHTVFLNRCTGGETISPGSDDSRQNKSSIIGTTRTFPAYPHGDASWNQVVADVRDIMGPFDIIVTDVDPGSTPHHEAIVCGTSFFGPGVLGVAPGTCGVIENSITYTFAAAFPNDPRYIAETIGQEVAHAWGLFHEFDCDDIMTYLDCGDKYFRDRFIDCACVNDSNQWAREPCPCGGTSQNSFEKITLAFGPAAGSPPDVTITEPLNNANVSPGFVVRANVDDPNGVASVSLVVDGVTITTLQGPPYVFNAPSDLVDGSHEVKVVAVDALGTDGDDRIFVIIGEPCGGPEDCPSTDTCVDGRCVLGPDEPGGLGQPCNGGENCKSGLCAEDSDGKRCTETCDPTLQACPAGFECLDTGGGGGVCWGAGSGGDGGGCAIATGNGASGAPWLGTIIGLIGLALLRRRRGSSID